MIDLFELKREFLEYCELDKGQSVLTVANYDRYLSKFLKWLKDSLEQGEGSEEKKLKSPSPQLLTPDLITQESVRQYRLYVNRLQDKKGRELKDTTQNYHILAVRAFLRYLSFRGIRSLPPEKISIGKTGDREITFLESFELDEILNKPDITKINGIRDRAILELLFSTGMRVSELVRLDISDINFERGEIAVLGKGKKLRVVFISEDAMKWLLKYIKTRNIETESEAPLFLSNKKVRLTARTVERIVNKYAAQTGSSKKISPHTFRHSFATDLLISGADLRSVQSLLGHSSITTTQIYTHITDQHLRDIHQKFHGKTIKNDEISNTSRKDILESKNDN